jgi:hypothetical protein
MIKLTIIERSFQTIFGTEYCFNCKKICSITKKEDKHRIYVVCNICHLPIASWKGNN